MTRYLLEGGIVLSLDPDVGDFDRSDVLVEDDRIIAVGPGLGADAERCGPEPCSAEAIL